MSLIAAEAPLGEIQGTGAFLPAVAGGSSTTRLSINNLFSTVFAFLTIVAGLAFMLYFILGGINWLTAGGNADKVEAAKNQMTNAGIGLIIVVAAYTITGVVGLILGFDILDPIKTLGI